jgi:hypothetical protein
MLSRFRILTYWFVGIIAESTLSFNLTSAAAPQPEGGPNRLAGTQLFSVRGKEWAYRAIRGFGEDALLRQI